MTQSNGCSGEAESWTLHIPLIELPARFNRRTKKLVKQSPWLTLNDRDSWHRRKKLTTYYRETAARVAEEAQIPRMQLVHMVGTISYGNNRRLDPHNYMLTMKAAIDGFIDYDMLKDDSSQYLIGPDPRRDESLPVGLHMTIIRLE